MVWGYFILQKHYVKNIVVLEVVMQNYLMTVRWFNIPRENYVLDTGMNFVTYLNVLMYVYQIQGPCMYLIYHIKFKCFKIYNNVQCHNL